MTSRASRDRIAHTAHAGDRACRERGAVHDRGVAVSLARRIEHRTTTCIEQRLILERRDATADDVERRPAFFQKSRAGLDDPAKGGGVASGRGHCASAAVDDEGDGHGRSIPWGRRRDNRGARGANGGNRPASDRDRAVAGLRETKIKRSETSLLPTQPGRKPGLFS